jgi:hypothetical protein
VSSLLHWSKEGQEEGNKLWVRKMPKTVVSETLPLSIPSEALCLIFFSSL